MPEVSLRKESKPKIKKKNPRAFTTIQVSKFLIVWDPN